MFKQLSFSTQSGLEEASRCGIFVSGFKTALVGPSTPLLPPCLSLQASKTLFSPEDFKGSQGPPGWGTEASALELGQPPSVGPAAAGPEITQRGLENRSGKTHDGQVYSFSVAGVTNCHRFSSLTQREWISSQVRSPGALCWFLCSSCHEGKVKVSARRGPAQEVPGGLQAIQEHWLPLSCFPCAPSSNGRGSPCHTSEFSASSSLSSVEKVLHL